MSHSKMKEFVVRLWILVCLFLKEAVGCTRKDSPFGCASGPCEVGTFYDVTAKSCTVCPSGFYMAATGHNCTSCRPCTEAVAANKEVQLAACTPSHDTKIGCDKHYFMTVESKGLHYELSCWRCSKCKKGQRPVLKCSANQNTVCAPVKSRECSKSSLLVRIFH